MTAEIEREWPGVGEIVAIVWCDLGGECVEKVVGTAGVTRIEKTVKSGLHSDLPYVRVWAGDVVQSEHCQHALTGVFFRVPA